MANTLVIRESDVTIDTTILGSTINKGLLAVTGLLADGSPYQKTKLIEVQMEYECDEAQTLIFEYTNNGGVIWTPYSTKAIVATIGPTILSVRQTLIHHNLQLRVRTTGLGKLRIISMMPRMVEEAMVSP